MHGAAPAEGSEPMDVSRAHFVMMMIANFAGPGADQQIRSQDGDRDSGDHAEPGIELFGDNVFRGIQRDGSQQIHADGMRGGDDQA